MNNSNTTPQQLASIEQRINNMLKFGIVKEINLTEATVKVEIDGKISGWLPWLERRAGANVKTWSPPNVGEQVLLLSVSGLLENAVILAGLNSDKSPTPSTNEQEEVITFGDGATIKYNQQSHSLFADLPSGATTQLNSSGGFAVFGNTNIDGDLRITGDITVSGNCSIGGDSTIGGNATISGICAAGGFASSTGGAVQATGGMNLQGAMTVSDDATIGGISFNSHIHTDAEGRPTTTPNQ